LSVSFRVSESLALFAVLCSVAAARPFQESVRLCLESVRPYPVLVPPSQKASDYWVTVASFATVPALLSDYQGLELELQSGLSMQLWWLTN
jgi:hypothetical protein